MIFQKGQYWGISGSYVKYSSYESAKEAYDKQQSKIAAREAEEYARHQESIKKIIEKLGEGYTPYEVMIEKNICKLCNLEPCECLHYMSKTGLGESPE